MTLRRRATVAIAGLALALAAVALGASAASAHDSLVDATPAEGETVTSLSEVHMEFSGDLLGADEGADIVQVIDAAGSHYETGCAAVAGPVITMPVALGAAGTYTVQWRIVSSDGHPVAKAYTFDYAPAAGEPVAQGTEASACASAVAAAAADPESSSTQGSGPDPILVGLLIGGVVIVGIIVAVIMILRPRKSEADAS
ncbi:copper resistance CopC family protein [uncultured Microbacterium sp.]|uniref:copper resistance CopC family protein n=1 Tax=uncultured Microbacterium sp. TaxID=191216 RepID=UPI0035CA358A